MESTLMGKDALAAAIRIGNVNIAGTMQMEVMDLNLDSLEAQKLHAEKLRKFETQKKSRTIVVPTAPEEVKAKLRELGHPVTFFGEGHGDRRERLREVIASLELDGEDLKKLQDIINAKAGSHGTNIGGSSGQQIEHKITQKEVFYSPATEALVGLRKYLCDYSFARAEARITSTKRVRDDEEQQALEDREVLSLYDTCKDVILNSSQYGDDRPLNCVRFSPHGGYIATSSLTTVVKVWDATEMSCIEQLRGHEERVTKVAWHPQAFADGSSIGVLASACADKTCMVWEVTKPTSMAMEGVQEGEDGVSGKTKVERVPESSQRVLQQFRGHEGIVSACEFHPCGRIVGTTSHDYTWRLWDLEYGQEMLLQDGHSKEVSSLTFQTDGSLLLTTDFAGVALVWDLRSGQQVQVFQGHVKKISCSAFNPNGFQVVTGGTDNMVRIWDLRKRKCGYCLPAHSNILSDVRISHSGELMATSSFDGTVKVWGTRDYRLVNTMSAHTGKVMSCDFAPDQVHIVSAGFDRTVKMWAHKSEF